MLEKVNRALEHFKSTSRPGVGQMRMIEDDRPDQGLLPNTGGGSDVLPRVHLAGTLKSGHSVEQVRSQFQSLPSGVAVTVREWDGRTAHILLVCLHDAALTARIRSAWHLE